MKENRLRAMFDDGGTAFGAFCNTPSTYSAEVFADEGFDYVCIDTQHGLIGYDSMWPMLQAMRFADTTPLVRVPDIAGGWAAKALDAGAEGVIFPMIESADDAARAVRAVRYAPQGARSFGPVRAGMLIGSDTHHANRQNMCIVMIETVAGVEHAHEICATEGVDAVYIGPADLAVSLGVPRDGWFSDDRHVSAMSAVREMCERHGVIPGIHTAGGEHGASLAAEGFRMLTIAMDTTAIRMTAQAQLAHVRSGDATGTGLYG
ncbi:MAG: aldolase/citrate lyase family protein [Acidimicrobiales bacterium]